MYGKHFIESNENNLKQKCFEYKKNDKVERPLTVQEQFIY